MHQERLIGLGWARRLAEVMKGTDSRPGGWRPWLVWVASGLTFVAAMFSRTSFGVASLEASERFNTPVALMSAFVVVQMVVYAGMQIPAGLLLDRLGSRKTITIGMAVITVGQLGLALATSFPVGLGVRVLIGGGDALIFISTIRLIPAWFHARHVPLLTQSTAVAGQLGQWASAVPLVRILTNFGWTAAFLTVAGACAAGMMLNLLFVRDTPPGVEPPRRRDGQSAFAALREVVGMPAAQLGFFIHMATAYFPLIFTFMWGFPFLIQGQGLSDVQAGNLFTVFVVAGIIAGPAMGVLTRVFERQRTVLALGIAGFTVLMWAGVLLWPGSAPLALLVALMVGLAVCFPASNIAFDINRSYVPLHQMGTGSGLVIVGGFFAALVSIGIIGAVLTWVGGATPGPFAFRLAMATQLPIWLIAAAMVLRSRRRLRAAYPDAG